MFPSRKGQERSRKDDPSVSVSINRRSPVCAAARRYLRRTRETDARVLPQIDTWHSSRSLEDSILTAYRAALYDTGRQALRHTVVGDEFLILQWFRNR